jgi:uncharacterized protein
VSTKGLTSLPYDILFLIVSYLAYLDRFRLKIVGNHYIAAAISTLPRPSFGAYLAQLNILDASIKIAFAQNGFDIGCKEGYDALVLRLLQEFKKWDRRNIPEKGWFATRAMPRTDTEFAAGDLHYIANGLNTAFTYHQKSVVQLLLEQIPPATPFWKFLPRHERWDMKRMRVLFIALNKAAASGDEQIVRLLLKQGAWSSQAIYEAASRGHQDIVTILSSKRALWHLYYPRRDLLGALIGAAENGHDATVKFLLDRGAEIPQNSSYPSAMHLAAKGGHETICRLLLSKGAKDFYVNPGIRCSRSDGLDYLCTPVRLYKDFENWCCLHFAIYGKLYHLVKFLLEMEIIPRDLNHHRETALPLAAMYGCVDIVKLLLENGFNVLAQLERYTALELAATFGYTEIMTLLLDAGATASLTFAARSDSASAVSLLLERGADIEATDDFGNIALHFSVLGHHPEIVHCLLKSGAQTEAVNRYSQKPLAYAIKENQVDCVSLLLEYGAGTECISYTTSALFCASRSANLIPLLLQYGANIEAEGFDGMRPLHTAAMGGDGAVIEILLASGAAKHARDALQRTALHYAAQGSSDAVSTLLSWGLSIHVEDARGQTPLHRAACNESNKLYDLLVSHGADPARKDHGGISAYQQRSKTAEAVLARGS